jgi:uncharacterized protein (DUF2126 family)
MLPSGLWRDFEEVLAWLDDHHLGLPPEPFRAFLELRCPVAGRIEADGAVLEVRNALEPWNVLGEEPSGGGTSRYVDSSVERIEVRVEGLVPDRHLVAVNGLELPLRATGRAGEAVGGVRFRAWAPPHALHPHLGMVESGGARFVIAPPAPGQPPPAADRAGGRLGPALGGRQP